MMEAWAVVDLSRMQAQLTCDARQHLLGPHLGWCRPQRCSKLRLSSNQVNMSRWTSIMHHPQSQLRASMHSMREGYWCWAGRGRRHVRWSLRALGHHQPEVGPLLAWWMRCSRRTQGLDEPSMHCWRDAAGRHESTWVRLQTCRRLLGWSAAGWRQARTPPRVDSLE